MASFALLAAWSLSAPLYSGPDEPAQVLRAVSLVDGQLLGQQSDGPHSPNVDVSVPAWLATARNAPYCFIGHPSVPAGCEKAPVNRGGSVVAPTYVGRYPPLYYALVGWPALVTSGSTALYLMRLASAAVCSFWLAGALWCALRSRWRPGMVAGIALAVTPQVVFLGSVVNASGLEISAALCMWSAGMVVANLAANGDPLRDRAALGWLIAAAIVLTCTRPISPLFTAMIGLCLGVVAGRRGLMVLLRTRTARWGLGSALLAGAAAAAWILGAGALSFVPTRQHMPAGQFDRIATSFVNVVEMAPQYLGAFGWVDTFLPVAVTVIGLTAGGILLGLSWLMARRRLRGVTGGMAAVFVLLPTLLSYSQASQLGVFGQARTWMPLWIGLPVVAMGASGSWFDETLIISKRARLRAQHRRLPLLFIAAGALALQLFSWWWALERYRVGLGHSPAGPKSWNPPLPAWVLAGLVSASLAAVASLCRFRRAVEPVTRFESGGPSPFGPGRKVGMPKSPFSTSTGTFRIGGDLPVARLGYGAMQITGQGVWGEPADPQEAIRVLRRAVELGVTLIDTADSYGPYVSEDLIRQALQPYPDDLVVATKAGLVRTGPGEWHPVGRPEYLRQEAEMSLRRLGLERIDLFQLHRVDPQVPLEDQVGELVALQEEGKVRHIGLSEVSVEQIVAARKVGRVVTVQNLYNLVNRGAENVLDYCAKEEIGFIPWFPIATGKLAKTGGPLQSLADQTGATPAQLALAWLLRRSPVMLPIPGTSSVAHLEENLKAAALDLTDEQLGLMERAA